MADLSYITTCKGRLAHLRQSLPRVVGQPGMECIVVDYACPENTADWVMANHPQVKIVRVTGETGFNPARARNLGARAATTPWLGFFDADILWSPELASRVIPILKPHQFVRPDPPTLQSWGSIICSKADFERIGGYDEIFTGWGGEDDDLIARLSMYGCVAAGLPASLVSEIPHDDTMRMRFHEIKDRRLSRCINHLYLQAKLDLMRLLGQPLAVAARQALWTEIHAQALLAHQAGNWQTRIEVSMPTQVTGPPPIGNITEVWHLKRTLTYHFEVSNQDSLRSGG